MVQREGNLPALEEMLVKGRLVRNQERKKSHPVHQDQNEEGRKKRLVHQANPVQDEERRSLLAQEKAKKRNHPVQN